MNVVLKQKIGNDSNYYLNDYLSETFGMHELQQFLAHNLR